MKIQFFVFIFHPIFNVCDQCPGPGSRVLLLPLKRYRSLTSEVCIVNCSYLEYAAFLFFLSLVLLFLSYYFRHVFFNDLAIFSLSSILSTKLSTRSLVLTFSCRSFFSSSVPFMTVEKCMVRIIFGFAEHTLISYLVFLLELHTS